MQKVAMFECVSKSAEEQKTKNQKKKYRGTENGV